MSIRAVAAPIAVLLALAVATAIAGDDPAKVAPKAAEQCTRLSGVVVDPKGRPVARSRVEILDAAGVPLHPDPLVTASDGVFAFDRLDPGAAYRIRAIAEDRAWTKSDAIVPRKEEVRITLALATTLTGRVVNADRKPVANVAVELRLAEAPYPIRGTTRAGGSFALTPVGETSGELVAVWREVVDTRCRRKLVVRREVSAKDDGLTISLGKELEIVGTSVAADGQSGRGVGVQAIPVARATGANAQGDDWCATLFAADGSFRIQGLPKGRYRLREWYGDALTANGPEPAVLSGTVEVEAGTTDVVLKFVQPR